MLGGTPFDNQPILMMSGTQQSKADLQSVSTIAKPVRACRKTSIDEMTLITEWYVFYAFPNHLCCMSLKHPSIFSIDCIAFRLMCFKSWFMSASNILIVLNAVIL